MLQFESMLLRTGISLLYEGASYNFRNRIGELKYQWE
jgi:hypothetical protein